MNATEDDIIRRKKFLKILKISDRAERRRRRSGQPWVPHLRIGNRIYYRRSAVEEFLRAQEAACMGEAAAGDQDLTEDGTPHCEASDTNGDAP